MDGMICFGVDFYISGFLKIEIKCQIMEELCGTRTKKEKHCLTCFSLIRKCFWQPGNHIITTHICRGGWSLYSIALLNNNLNKTVRENRIIERIITDSGVLLWINEFLTVKKKSNVTVGLFLTKSPKHWLDNYPERLRYSQFREYVFSNDVLEAKHLQDKWT